MGDNVQSVSTREKGVVVLVYPKRTDRLFYDVVFESGLRKPVLNSSLIPHPSVSTEIKENGLPVFHNNREKVYKR